MQTATEIINRVGSDTETFYSFIRKKLNKDVASDVRNQETALIKKLENPSVSSLVNSSKDVIIKWIDGQKQIYILGLLSNGNELRVGSDEQLKQFVNQLILKLKEGYSIYINKRVTTDKLLQELTDAIKVPISKSLNKLQKDEIPVEVKEESIEGNFWSVLRIKTLQEEQK